MAFLNPADIVVNLDILPGIRAADFGSGPGHFTIELARRIGNAGKVYAFDIQKEPLEALRSKLRLDNITNVETSRVNLETEKGTGLEENSVDFVLISNMLMQAENKEAVAGEAFRILKPGGHVALIEWSADAGGLGPPKTMRIAKEEANNIFQKSGFVFEKEFNAGDSHYGLFLRKQL
jgi:ubiquinone/menaquinone biosynthesis C-methylase UbiE